MVMDAAPSPRKLNAPLSQESVRLLDNRQINSPAAIGADFIRACVNLCPRFGHSTRRRFCQLLRRATEEIATTVPRVLIRAAGKPQATIAVGSRMSADIRVMGRGAAVDTATTAPRSSALLFKSALGARTTPRMPAVELSPNTEFRPTMRDTGLDTFIANLKGYSGARHWMALGALPEEFRWPSAKEADGPQTARNAEALETVTTNLDKAVAVAVGGIKVDQQAVRRTASEMDGLRRWNVNAHALEAANRVVAASGRRITAYGLIPGVGTLTFGRPEAERWGYLVGLSAFQEPLLYVSAKPAIEK